MGDAFRINILNMHIAFLTNDDLLGATYEKPIPVPGIMQVQLAPRVKEGNLYGDGRLRNAIRKLDGYDITFDHNKLPPDILARMRGRRSSNGVRRGNADDQPVYFGIGFEAAQTEGYRELTWLTKCIAAPANKDLQQETDSINYSTDALAITSMSLEYNKDFEYIVDTSEDDPDGDIAEVSKTWFDDVPVMPPFDDEVENP